MFQEKQETESTEKKDWTQNRKWTDIFKDMSTAAKGNEGHTDWEVAHVDYGQTDTYTGVKI